MDPETLDCLTRRLLVHVGGGVVGVDHRGSTLVRAFGKVDIAGSRVDATPTDSYYLTSVTKGLVAMELMTLVDAGLLDLDAPVGEYLEDYGGGDRSRVTTRHLLTHTSGIDSSANLVEGPRNLLTPGDYLAAAVAAPIVTPPGQTFAYSSPGFWLLAELVRQLTGISHVEHFAQAVAAPMSTTMSFLPGAEPPPRLVRPRCPPHRAHVLEQVRLTAYPAGGLIGDVHDLISVGRCVLAGGEGVNGRVLSRRAVAAMGVRGSSGVRDERLVSWGLGWELGGPGTLWSPATWYHYGSSGVGIWIDFELDATVVLFTDQFLAARRLFAEFANGVVGTLLRH